jgi:putative SOS response-associated peptidase YedK
VKRINARAESIVTTASFREAMREANPKVNNARNNGPEMLERVSVATESEQLSL